MAMCRVVNGTIKAAQELLLLQEGKQTKGKVTALYIFHGLDRTDAAEVGPGDICLLAGFPEVGIGDTFCDPLVARGRSRASAWTSPPCP